MVKSLILMFHEVQDPEWFEGVLQHLAKRIKFISYEELITRITNEQFNDKCAHVTVDDGHISYFENAYPVLKKHGIASTLFVSPKIIELEQNYWFQRVRPLLSEAFQRFVVTRSACFFHRKVDRYSVHAIIKSLQFSQIDAIISEYENDHPKLVQPYMNISQSQLQHLSETGLVEIGAHTLNHPILANESDNDSAREIIKSITDLSSLIRKPIRTFAYPNGQPSMDFGQREMKTLRELGIELAFSTESSSIYQVVNLMSIPRIGISKGNPMYVTQKIRFARQWKNLRSMIYKKTESTERNSLIKTRILYPSD